MSFAYIGIILTSLIATPDHVAPLLISEKTVAAEESAATETEATETEATEPVDEPTEAEEKAPAPKLGAKSLSTGGWILMLLSVSIVTCMLIWCIYKVLATPESTQHLHSQADIEPPDIHDEDENRV